MTYTHNVEKSLLGDFGGGSRLRGRPYVMTKETTKKTTKEMTFND